MASIILAIFSFLSSLYSLSSASAVQLQSHNIDDILTHNELVFVNFYADWCRFSQMLKPVYEDTAKKLAEEFPGTGKLALGKVDCDRETSIAQKYQVTKYPTLKLFRNGQLVKREYRGQRSVDAMTKFLRDQLIDPIERTDDLESLEELDKKKRHVIGYFAEAVGREYESFQKIASALRDDCKFHAVIGDASLQERTTGNKVLFRPTGEYATDIPFTGPLGDPTYLQHWATDKCVPLVREITFENAEELTEEGLPFLILFHNKDDTDTPEAFKKIVSSELITEKNSMNFLTADGEKFTHPLYHLGKTANDLPVLAIDSFRHMYIWKHDVKNDLAKPGLLLQFVKDLQSGKLHREFHHGPDKTAAPTAAPDGSNDTALATNDDNGNQDNTLHFNVQQQVIINGDGVRMQVVRFVQIGAQQPVDLREHLDSIAAVGFGDHGDKDVAMETDDGRNSDNTDENKIDASKDQEDGTDKAFYDALNAEREKQETVESKEEKLAIPIEDVNPKMRVQNLPGPGSDSENLEKTRNAWEQHRMDTHHQKHHRGNSDETTTKSYTKVTELKMKLADEEFDVKDTRSPPESIFRKLGPSRDRYTILREEL